MNHFGSPTLVKSYIICLLGKAVSSCEDDSKRNLVDKLLRASKSRFCWEKGIYDWQKKNLPEINGYQIWHPYPLALYYT